MPRNVEENIYVTLAFSRTSSVWEQLQREANALDLSVAHLIKVLLADRSAALEGHGKHLWFPREMPPPLAPARHTDQPMPSPEKNISRRLEAAAAAAQYWDD